MSTDLELEQRLTDLTESMQEAVASLGQGIADVVEILGERKDERIEQLLASVSEQLAAVLKQESSHKLAEAIIAGLKGIKFQAPDVKVEVAAPTVNVAPAQITVEPAPINLSPTIQVPQQAAPQIVIEGAKEWRLQGVSYDRLGRITDASIKRVS